MISPVRSHDREGSTG